MMNSNANARLGIQLAQQGRRQEALTYLRLAVQTEPPHVEVWLWLAHVTPLREEYHHCVQQALSLDPYHNTARQMHGMLNPSELRTTQFGTPTTSLSSNSQQMAVDDNLIHKMQRQRNSRRQRRWLLMLVLLGGLLATAIVIGTTFRDVLENDTDASTSTANAPLVVSVTPQNRDFSVSFSMQASETWLLATTDNAEWQAAKAAAGQGSALNNVLTALETDLTMLQINPANDDLVPQVRIVETNREAIVASSGQPLRLELVRLGAVYASMDDTSCRGIEQLANEQQRILDSTAATSSQTVIESRVIAQQNDRCLLFIHYFGRSALSELDEHIYVMFVPVGNQQLAEWHLTVVEPVHVRYQSAIETLLTTLQSD